MNSTSTINKSWRRRLRVHPVAELFPLLDKESLAALATDIKKHGLKQRVSIIDDEGANVVLIDGRNRLDALELLGEEITLDNRTIFERIPPDIDIYARVISLNIHRRHLTSNQKRELLGNLLQVTPEKSDRQIGALAKVDHKTVAVVRKGKEARGEIPHVETRIDTRARVVTTRPRVSRWKSLQNKVRDLKAENRWLKDEATPLIPAWDKASPEQRIEFLKARRGEIMRAQHREAYSKGLTDQNDAADTSRDGIHAAASEPFRGPQGTLPPPPLVKTIVDRTEATSRAKALQDDRLDIPPFLRRRPTGEPTS
jgi:ParB-like chromosome segregation protein Spo0J